MFLFWVFGYLLIETGRENKEEDKGRILFSDEFETAVANLCKFAIGRGKIQLCNSGKRLGVDVYFGTC